MKNIASAFLLLFAISISAQSAYNPSSSFSTKANLVSGGTTDDLVSLTNTGDIADSAIKKADTAKVVTPTLTTVSSATTLAAGGNYLVSGNTSTVVLTLPTMSTSNVMGITVNNKSSYDVTLSGSVDGTTSATVAAGSSKSLKWSTANIYWYTEPGGLANPVPVANGGTGATTAANARINLNAATKGILTMNIATKTSAYTLTSSDFLVMCSGTFTASLPASSGSGICYVIKNSGTGVITVSPNGTDTIDGSSSETLSAKSALMIVDSASGTWSII